MTWNRDTSPTIAELRRLRAQLLTELVNQLTTEQQATFHRCHSQLPKMDKWPETGWENAVRLCEDTINKNATKL